MTFCSLPRYKFLCWIKQVSSALFFPPKRHYMHPLSFYCRACVRRHHHYTPPILLLASSSLLLPPGLPARQIWFNSYSWTMPWNTSNKKIIAQKPFIWNVWTCQPLYTAAAGRFICKWLSGEGNFSFSFSLSPHSGCPNFTWLSLSRSTLRASIFASQSGQSDFHGIQLRSKEGTGSMDGWWVACSW
jgi:hypothetical protein